MGVSQLATAQGHITGISWGWVGNTNLILADLKHLLPEWPSQIANRDNPAQVTSHTYVTSVRVAKAH